MEGYFILLFGFLIVNIHINKCHMTTEGGLQQDTVDATNPSGTHQQSSTSSGHQVCQPNVYLAPVINCSTADMLREVSHLRQEVTLLNERVHRLTERIGSSLPGTLLT